MAVTRRGYIFGAFVSGVTGVLFIVVALASDSWVVSTLRVPSQQAASNIRYGLFGGELTLREMATPQMHPLHMTCAVDVNACAVSCKTERESRLVEVRALANGYRPTAACGGTTEVDTSNPLDTTPVISFAFYVILTTLLVIDLVLGVAAAGLAILNATKNPTEPVFGLPGCLWTNVAAALVGITVMLMFGIYWLTSGLNEHLAISYIALGLFTPEAGLGFSYWLLLGACLCFIANVVLIQTRAYFLERDPTHSFINIHESSDTTVGIY
ncbi:unnamed protein product [Spodoptera littoralis]|uniref:Uncharacterized protein n=1 Tax=Spodoptera littoralis TaxID=7109 RepID=A0A9P0N3Y7_SPOLI|nr:unnamed protein product [Spodoptera littoralis]CAH1641578.1 unnamed protein product [Spodoptera littoralis]